jgi:hypothetical protein
MHDGECACEIMTAATRKPFSFHRLAAQLACSARERNQEGWVTSHDLWSAHFSLFEAAGRHSFAAALQSQASRGQDPVVCARV